MRRADELDHDVGSAAVRGRQHGIGEALVVDGLAAELAHERRRVGAAHRSEHPRAGGDADLHGRAADAARGAVHEQRLAQLSAAWLRIASCAVMNASGTAAAPGSSSASGTAVDAALVHDDAVGEPAAADEAEDAVARLPAEHLRAAGLDGAGDLEAGMSRGLPGGAGIRALALRQVGRDRGPHA